MTNPATTTPHPTTPTCVDCTLNPSTTTIRRRPLCPTCLVRFISSKILKRLDSVRPRVQNQGAKIAPERPRLLVPLSGETSSTALLGVLVAHIRRQIEKTGRTGYQIVGCHVGMDMSEGVAEWWSKVTETFPECEFLPVVRLTDVLTLDLDIIRDLSLVDLEKTADEDADDFLLRMFTSARSATARLELREILLKRLIAAMAKKHDCESVLWGHSDTKLAATILSLVAKGRGSNVASELADGSVLWGMKFNYPCRDLYKGELEVYLDCVGGEIKGCLLQAESSRGVSGEASMDKPVVSLKGMSIDELLGTYIGREGEKYPGIMANVVRTSGKLIAPEAVDGLSCRLCAGQIESETGQQEQLICYGCQRMKQDIRT